MPAALLWAAATMGALTGSAPTKLTKLRAVLFDIDGTLVNSDGLHFAVFQDVLADYGYNNGERISEAFFKERITGKQNKRICEDLFPDWDEAEAVAFAEHKEARFRELAAEQLSSLVTPGLAHLLRHLEANGVRCAAVTNAPRANAELMLSSIDRLAFFEPLIIGDECVHAKPHPEPYLAAMRALGVSADECIAVEDSPSGAAAAVAAGARTIGITSTQSEEALNDAGCDLLVRDFEDARLWSELNESWGCGLATRGEEWDICC